VKCKIDAHEGSVNALCVSVDVEGQSFLVSGGKEGRVKLWKQCDRKLDLELISEFSIGQSMGDLVSLGESVRAISWDMNAGKLVLGTSGSDILEFTGITDLESLPSARKNFTVLTRGHSEGELWGLAAHPEDPNTFITTGDDKTVRLWNANKKAQVNIAQLKDRSRAVDFSPDGEYIVCGFGGPVDGRSAGKAASKAGSAGISLLHSATLKASGVKDAKGIKKNVSDIKYSPNGNILAVASHDTNVWLYDAKTLKRQKKLTSSSSSVTHVDWSKDSSTLQTNDMSYELLYYSESTGNQITKASSLKDTEWKSWTCPLGWPTEGIWPAEADGTDINAVHRSQKGDLLASADDHGQVKLFRYPCPLQGESDKGRGQFHASNGHSSHVTNVRFNSNDTMLFSTGGNDRAIFQWKLV